MKRQVRLLLVDDHQVVLESMSRVLATQPGFQVVGLACDGLEAMRLAGLLNPDVVILDVTMPRQDGPATARGLASVAPDVKVLALSMHAERLFVEQMLESGALGYVTKSAPFDELLSAIQQVADGQIFLCAEVKESLARDYSDEELAEAIKALSEMDRRVLHLVAEGLSSKDVGEVLSIAKKTVDYHRQNIMRKLGLGGVAEITRFAVRAGMTPLDRGPL